MFFLIFSSLGLHMQINVSYLCTVRSALTTVTHGVYATLQVIDLHPCESQKQEYWNPAVVVRAHEHVFPVLHPCHCQYKINLLASSG